MIFMPLKVRVFGLTSHASVTPISTNNNYTTDGKKNKIYPVVWGKMLKIVRILGWVTLILKASCQKLITLPD